MTFYLDPSFAPEKEARRNYLQETFKIYFYEKQDSEIKNVIVLESFPKNFEENICIVLGHYPFVVYLLKLNVIKEKEIFIISCSLSHPEIFKSKGKKTYLILQQNGYAVMHFGKEYGFDFNPTDAEINMFLNKKSNVREKIMREFQLIK